MGLLSGIKDTLFGTGGGTVSPSRSTSNSRSFGASSGFDASLQNIFGPQAEALSPLFQFTNQLQNQFQGNPQQLVAGFTPFQQQGQALSQDASQLAQTIAGQLPQTAQTAQQGFQSLMNTDVASNPFFQSAVQASINPFLQNFSQNIIPEIRSQAVGVGQAGSSREGIAQGLATQGLNRQIGDVISRMGNQAFGQSLQSQLGALGQLPNLISAQQAPFQTLLAGAQPLLDVGAQQQSLAQQQALAPFTLASSLRDILGTPIPLTQQLGARSAFDTSQSTSESTGAITEGPQKGLLDFVNVVLEGKAPGFN